MRRPPNGRGYGIEVSVERSRSDWTLVELSLHRRAAERRASALRASAPSWRRYRVVPYDRSDGAGRTT